MTTHGVHGALHFYSLRTGRVRPYGGVGLGYAALRADFGWNWRRNADPLDITTGRTRRTSTRFAGISPVQPARARRVSRKASICSCTPRRVDFAVSDRISIGVRACRLQYPSVEVGQYVGDVLRSHAPNLHLDGSEPVAAWPTLPGAGVTEVGVPLKYQLRRPVRD